MRRHVELATVCSDGFLPGALVCLYSYAQSIPEFSRHPLTVFWSQAISPLSPESRAAIEAVAPHARFEKVEREAYCAAHCPTPAHKAAFLTLEVFHARRAGAALFFDADTLCVADCSEVFDIAYDFVACRAEAQYTGESGTRRWCPINTGFFLVGERWRTNATFKALLEGIELRADTSFADQAVVNRQFEGCGLHLLPEIYNFRHWGGTNRWGEETGSDELFRALRPQIKVIHYSGYLTRAKPWTAGADPAYGAVAEWHRWATACTEAHPELKRFLRPRDAPGQ